MSVPLHKRLHTCIYFAVGHIIIPTGIVLKVQSPWKPTKPFLLLIFEKNGFHFQNIPPISIPIPVESSPSDLNSNVAVKKLETDYLTDLIYIQRMCVKQSEILCEVSGWKKKNNALLYECTYLVQRSLWAWGVFVFHSNSHHTDIIFIWISVKFLIV